MNCKFFIKYSLLIIRNNLSTKAKSLSANKKNIKIENNLNLQPEIDEKLETELVKEVKKKPRLTILDQIQKSKNLLPHLNTIEDKKKFLSKFPDFLLKKKTKTPVHFYLINPETAKLISNHLTHKLPDNLPIVEVNPGPGLLTKELLNIDNLKNLILYETYDQFIPDLEELHSLYPDRVKVKRGDLVNIWKLLYRDKIDSGTRVHDFFIDIPKTNYNDGINCRLFGGIGSYNFFKHLIKNLTFHQSLLSYGRSELYLIVPPATYIHLTCNNEIGYSMYRSTSVLFQIMFEYYFIEKIPRNHFLPMQSDSEYIRRKKLTKIKSIDSDSLYLVKIVPRKNLYDLCSLEDMPALWYFIKQNLISRKCRIIPNLEKWVPGCGARLLINLREKESVKVIRLGKYLTKDLPQFTKACTTMSNRDYYDSTNIFTEFGDLTPSQILTLFTEFRLWPEYKTSPFLASLENTLLKMEQSDENEDHVEIDIPIDIEPAEENK